MRRYPLAALVTAGGNGIEANHLPLLHDPEPAPYGTLRGHFARANPQWRTIQPEVEVLAIFQGPQAYVTPSHYPSKSEHGKVVPTWNYAVVHARAVAVIHHDAAWLRELVERLTREHERRLPKPWDVADAPATYIDGLLGAIVGIELRILSLEGKWKVSQNRNEADRAGVASAFESSGGGDERELAQLIRARGAPDPVE
jgi:transcriptional regulator